MKFFICIAACSLLSTCTGFVINARQSPRLQRRSSRVVESLPELPLSSETATDFATELAAQKSYTPPEGYWQGEWYCADCGYIYDPADFGGRFFEDQSNKFKCPQCAGPRRRFAKKVGDKIGEKLGGSDAPIYVISIIGLLITVAVAVWASGEVSAPAS
uniref:Rubredoxin-like domain-containing protein n=1 Tax=Chromera velia CCMP2878 TaxID=1169474 RepID=A0A0G4GB71_9ALVE|mmetsp:Transcript_50790/g.99873  ORF Transcript_50790/g.99873 Transcript_50790/m.99873 type:complete len:159 (+) Transcript_50790:237-713(+)|eukprot:Cvel_4424.t1-p1 / transcript=Cvel_4424.t1 / gene=Cvel_4424 / organism=Chromera_velia_CCMP2878 / gene_product=Rubredoxin-1, putative / transcript_product=Rubredoxin-1, putative / location=Cvel_scaffold192:97234-98648(-) / protein_length=158 / sequence_SO=supercontig / SO=protein_coding / is_pseudo=false